MVGGVSPVQGLVQRLIRNDRDHDDFNRQVISHVESKDRISISSEARRAFIASNAEANGQSLDELKQQLLNHVNGNRLR